jgi:hypothetical protein
MDLFDIIITIGLLSVPGYWTWILRRTAHWLDNELNTTNRVLRHFMSLSTALVLGGLSSFILAIGAILFAP